VRLDHLLSREFQSRSIGVISALNGSQVDRLRSILRSRQVGAASAKVEFLDPVGEIDRRPGKAPILLVFELEFLSLFKG
jgi:hypothetical protein